MTLATLDELAARKSEPNRRADFVRALLSYVGADAWPSVLRSAIKQALLREDGESSSLMEPDDFLGRLSTALEQIGAQTLYTVSSEDLSRTRKALARQSPNFFSDPTREVGLLPTERAYILFLLWEQGSLGKRHPRPPVDGSYTTARFSNGERSLYIGRRREYLLKQDKSNVHVAIQHLSQLLSPSCRN
jgi:hypothetical protein